MLPSLPRQSLEGLDRTERAAPSMATARQPRSSPPAAHDFVARIASWRTSPSTSDYSPIASAEEPLLARTDAGWSRTPTEDARATKGSSRSTLSEAGGPSTHSTTHTRRWLVGCFAVILLAGSGWRISTNGNADLGRPAEVWNAAHESLPASSSTTVQGGHHALHGEQAEIAADLEDSWESPQSEGTTAPAATASPTAIVSPASETAPSRAPAWNVHPRPRPPTADLHAKSTTKYLAYENHSGFHNREFPRNSRTPLSLRAGTSPYRIRACTRRAQIPRQCTCTRPAAQPHASPAPCPTRARHAVGTRSQTHCRLLGAVQGRTRTRQACSHQSEITFDWAG